VKTEKQIQAAIAEVTPRASDCLNELASFSIRGEEPPAQLISNFAKYLSAVQTLRWALNDDEVAIDDLLSDKSQTPELLKFVEQFSRASRQ
jgi:hypothetical protein